MQRDLKSFDISEQLKKLPDSPGVYIMYNKENEIIYVGKSVSLKNRVRSYFNSDHSKYKKVQAMVENIYRFEYIIVNNETESLVLEANLIKKNRPKYNINLKDDKQYPYIKITNEKFPKILKVRDLLDDKAQYFGPFPTVSDLEKLVELSILAYKIRDCKLNFDNGKFLKRPCINYYINRCSAPCVKNISEDDYNETIKKVIKFLQGDSSDIKKILKNNMFEASIEKKYELASKYRDYLYEVDNLFSKQIFNIKKFKEYHLISYSYFENTLVVAIFIVNDGLVVDSKHFIVENNLNLTFDELFSNVIRQFYIGFNCKVKEIYIDYDNDKFLCEISKFLKSIYSFNSIFVKFPHRGIKHEQMIILNKNAKEILTKHMINNKSINFKYLDAIKYLKTLLSIETLDRIECYDISNISGDFNVGSMVVYKNGYKSKKDYRKFKINTVKGQDDYSSHREMLTRRLDRLIDEKLENKNSSFSQTPDLIIMDGGKGHFNVAKDVILEKNLNIAVIGLVKDDKHRTRAIVFDDNYIKLEVNSNIYRFLYDIQEEVHRFAINYHRSLQNKKLQISILDEIKGVGDVKKINLLKHFGSISNIKNASVQEILMVDKMDKTTANNIFNFFNRKD